MSIDTSLHPVYQAEVREALVALQQRQRIFTTKLETYQRLLVSVPAGDPDGLAAVAWSDVLAAQRALAEAQAHFVAVRRQHRCCLQCGYRLASEPAFCSSAIHRAAWRTAGAVPSRVAARA